MSFSDEDLICLETYMDNYVHPDLNKHFIDLIARLEAAEKIIEFRDSGDWIKCLDLWMKSAGRVE